MVRSFLLCGLLGWFLGGCEHRVSTHGWIGSFSNFKDVKVQQPKEAEQFQADITRSFGYPPLRSIFSENRYNTLIYYYIRRQTREKNSLFLPETIYYEGRELRFDSQEKLIKKTTISSADRVFVSPSPRKTPTYGHMPSLWSVFVRNLGRSGNQ